MTLKIQPFISVDDPASGAGKFFTRLVDIAWDYGSEIGGYVMVGNEGEGKSVLYPQKTFPDSGLQSKQQIPSVEQIMN